MGDELALHPAALERRGEENPQREQHSQSRRRPTPSHPGRPDPVKVQVYDNSAYDPDPIVVNRSDVAATIRPWFVDAPGEFDQAIRDLQRSLDTAPRGTLGTESTSGLCEYLGITLRIADAAEAAHDTTTTGELTQDEIDKASKLCRAEGVPIMYAENVARILREVGRKRPNQ